MLCVHKTLNQIGLVLIALFKINRQSSHAHAQNLRRQIVAVHTWPDQKTTHPDHSMQVRLLLFLIPPDPLVSIGQLQRGGGKTKASQPAVPGVNQVAQLPANQRAVT